MRKTLERAIRVYSEGSEDFRKHLAKHAQKELIEIFSDLLTIYINDVNSSTIREALTLLLAGYERRPGKIGYNGFKTDDMGRTINCEVKPKNIRREEGKQIKKLNGGGNFTDYTWNRLEKDKEENPNMLVSGFVDGKILYILEFPFRTDSFMNKLQKQLQDKFPHGDEQGMFLRSASFLWRDYIDSARLIYKAQDLANHSDFLVGKFLQKLEDMPLWLKNS